MTILACLTKVNDFLINDCILDDLLTVCPLCPTPQIVIIKLQLISCLIMIEIVKLYFSLFKIKFSLKSFELFTDLF